MTAVTEESCPRALPFALNPRKEASHHKKVKQKSSEKEELLGRRYERNTNEKTKRNEKIN